MEGARLQVADVDSARMVLHVHGKGKRDRYVPLPETTLQMLRQFWKTRCSRCSRSHSNNCSILRCASEEGWKFMRFFLATYFCSGNAWTLIPSFRCLLDASITVFTTN